VQILGCRLDPIDAEVAASRITAFAREGAGAQVVTLGTEMVVYAQRDAGFREIVNSCALSLCDTIGLFAVARLRGANLNRRVTGVELIEDLCGAAVCAGIGIYLVGGAPGIAERAAQQLRARYPGLNICGVRDGFFADQESPAVADAIRATGAQLLLVGLGSPRQEFWLATHLARTGCGSGIGVGGSFDVISGNVARAPQVWRRFGLEWLYRLVREPHRWRRQLALPYFVWLVLLDSLRTAKRAAAKE